MKHLLLFALLLLGSTLAHAQCAPFTDSFPSTGPLSSSWVAVPSLSTSSLVQASGQAEAATAATYGTAIVNTGTCSFSANQKAQFTLTTGTGGSAALLIRSTTAGNGYLFYLTPTYTSILICTAGSCSLLGSPTPCSEASGSFYAFSAVGTTLTATQNGSICETVTDSTYSSGQPGIDLQPSGATTGIQVTGFTATNFSLVLAANTCTGTALNATQNTAFAGCAASITGGTSPYTCSVSSSTLYQTLPEGMTTTASGSTCPISGSYVYGQGVYAAEIIVTDSVSNSANLPLTFSVAGNNTFGGVSLNPAGSVFSARLDSLPIDTTSPFATIYSGYSGETLRALFGPDAGGDGGICINTVPSTQAYVTVNATTTNISTGPFPLRPCIENGWNKIMGTNVDSHVAILKAAGATPASLWESYQLYPETTGVWDNGLNNGGAGEAGVALYNSTPPNIASFILLPQDAGSSNAAGTSIAAGLLNVDEIIGGCTLGSPCGAVKHAVNMTLQNTQNVYLYPGTARAGLGGANPCSGGYEDYNGLITQTAGLGTAQTGIGSGSGPPTLCGGVATNSLNPMGQTFIVPSTFSEPTQCSSNPITHIIFVGLQRYGMRVTDNGGSGYLEGTPDPRWPSTAVLNGCLNAIPLSVLVSPKVDSLAASGAWPSSSQATASGGTSGVAPFWLAIP